MTARRRRGRGLLAALWGRRSRPARALLVAAVVVVGYGGGTFAQVVWASRQHDAVAADAVVVLGAAQYDGEPSPVLRARLDHAAALYADGLAPVIVVTGGKQAGDRVTQGMAGFTYLRGAGVPESALRVEVDGTTTYQELAASARILRDEGLGDEVLLVSSPYTALRLEGVAREVGLVPHVAPVGSSSVSDLVREAAGVAVGRLIGYRRLDNLLG